MAKTLAEVTSLTQWKQALQISKEVLELCDGFSQSEQNFLVWQLRNSALAIPTLLATDLTSGKKAQPDAIVKCATEIELVNRIYPAVDTDDLSDKLTQLLAAIKEI